MTHTLKGEYPSREVWLDDKWLDPAPSQKIHNHSPDGFNWGYVGSGPSQLALAIMHKITGKADGYSELKWNLIAKLPQGKSFQVSYKLNIEETSAKICVEIRELKFIKENKA
jgi:hypothetical protein